MARSRIQNQVKYLGNCFTVVTPHPNHSKLCEANSWESDLRYTPSQQELMNSAAELQNLHPNRNSWSDAQGEENRAQAKRAA